MKRSVLIIVVLIFLVSACGNKETNIKNNLDRNKKIENIYEDVGISKITRTQEQVYGEILKLYVADALPDYAGAYLDNSEEKQMLVVRIKGMDDFQVELVASINKDVEIEFLDAEYTLQQLESINEQIVNDFDLIPNIIGCGIDVESNKVQVVLEESDTIFDDYIKTLEFPNAVTTQSGLKLSF